MTIEIGAIIGAFFSIMVLSMPLYKENLLFRFTEHTMIGISLGIGITISVKAISDNAISPVMGGQYLYLIPIIIGSLLLFRLSKKYALLYRIPMAVIIGVGMGLAVRGIAHAQIIKQIKATLKPIPMSTVGAFNTILIFVGVSITILYFVYTLKHTGVVRGPVMFGRYLMMVAFGVQYGNTVIGRMARLSGVLLYILKAFGLYS